MKKRLLLPMLLLSLLPAAPAAEPDGRVPGADLSAYKTADELWKYIESFAQPPKEQPATREEALALARNRFAAQAGAGVAFAKAYPTDPRRWAARMIAIRAEMQGRRISGQPPDPEIERTRLDEILNAADAPVPIKAEAAFTRVLTFAADFRTRPESYIQFQQAAAEFSTTYANHPLAAQMQTLQLRVLADDPTPQGAELLRKIAAGSDAPAAEIAKGIIAKRETLGDLKSRPVALEFTAADGRSVDLALMRGKVVLVTFWASNSELSLADLPNIVATYERLRKSGFEVVGVSLDADKAALKQVAKQQGVTWPNYFDGLGAKNKISSRYGIEAPPATWLIDKKGMLRETGVRGPMLEEAVLKLLKE